MREATIDALQLVIDQLVTLMFDTGVTVKELNHLIRDRAIRVATSRVIREYGRNNRSRVAIVTGLPRSAISKVLRTVNTVPLRHISEGAARRVLGGWFDNPRFLSESGEPSVLPIFGKKRSFEQLVAMYAAGAPVRAMLDELIQIDAVEYVPEQQVRAKSRVPILKGLSTNAIVAIGERCGDLLQTLTTNMRNPSGPLFEATAQTYETDPEMLPLVRRELATQGASFINAANALMKRSAIKSAERPSRHRTGCRVGVSIYYFEQPIDPSISTDEIKTGHRKNLRRQNVRQIGRHYLKNRKQNPSL